MAEETRSLAPDHSAATSVHPLAALGWDLADVLDAIADGITIQDGAGLLVYANSAAASLAGFASPQALMLADAGEIMASFEIFDDAGELIRLSQLPGRQVLVGVEAAERTVRFRMRGQTRERWARLAARPLRAKSGALFAINTFREITEAVEAERRLRLALDAGRLGTWEWDIVTGAVHWSEMLERIRGIPVGSFPGTFDASQRDMHPDDRDRVLSAVRSALEERRDHNILYRIVRPDGAVRWLEAFGRFLLNEDGQPIRLVGVCCDVTERVSAAEAHSALAAEQAARAQAEEARRIVALRADVVAAFAPDREVGPTLQACCDAIVRHLAADFARIWLTDADGEWLELCASAGSYTRADDAQRRIRVGDLTIGADRGPLLSSDAAHHAGIAHREWAKESGLVAFAGYPLLDGDRVEGVLALFSKDPLPDDTLGGLASVGDAMALGIARKRADVERDAHARELARSNAELDQFASVASHDLQEPLRMVTSYNQLLARRYQGKLGKDADEFIAFSLEAVVRMQRIISDLLAFSRVGTRKKDFEPVSMQTVLDLSCSNLRKAIEDQRALITHDRLPQVFGDEMQLVQLLQNLIDNAVKFHGEGAPRVHVGARKIDDIWELSVADNGIGIEAQYFERIFVIFQRLHSREHYDGTGIGLAICKKVVERHGGRIRIESTPGQGSTIFFTMPSSPSRRTTAP